MQVNTVFTLLLFRQSIGVKTYKEGTKDDKPSPPSTIWKFFKFFIDGSRLVTLAVCFIHPFFFDSSCIPVAAHLTLGRKKSETKDMNDIETNAISVTIVWEPRPPIYLRERDK